MNASRLLLVASAITLGAFTAQADKVIAINFNSRAYANGGDKDEYVIGDDQVENVIEAQVPGSAWTQFGNAASGSDQALKEYDTDSQSTVSLTDTKVSWSCANVWAWRGNGNNVADGANKFLNGYLDDGGTRAQITVTGIPYSSYDVVVFMVSDSQDNLLGCPSVNGKMYGWDADAGKTVVVSSATGWGTKQCTTVGYGQNALKITKQTGALSINGGKDGGRGCIAAVLIVEAQAAVGEIDGGSAYSTADLPVEDYDLFRLTMAPNGVVTIAGALTKPTAVISTGDVVLEPAAGYEVTAEDLGLLSFSDVAGKVTFRNVTALPAAPGVGRTIRFEGTRALDVLPYSAVPFGGVVEVACPIGRFTPDGDAGLVIGTKNYVFDTGFSVTTEERVAFGNRDDVTQNITINGGVFNLNREEGDSTAAHNATTPFLMDHYRATVNYTFNHGTVLVPNGSVAFGWDGVVNMTLGTEDGESALFKVKGLDKRGRNGTSTMTIKPTGELSLGLAGADANTNKKIVLDGGKLSVYETATAKVDGGVEVRSESTIDVPTGLTMTLKAPLSGAGTLVKTGAGKLVIAGDTAAFTGKIRVADASEVDVGTCRKFDGVADGSVLSATESVAENLELGAVTFEGLGDATVTVTRNDGTTYVAHDGVTGIRPIIVGKMALADWTFTNTLTSVGIRTTTLSWDNGHSAADGYAEKDGKVVLKTKCTPYTGGGFNYPETWTCMVAGVVPNLDKGILIAFGTKADGAIGLAAGSSANEVLVVRTTGDRAYIPLATMNVTNARSTMHTYAFVKTPTSITVYLDGKKWNETSVLDVTFGNQLQIGSLHGNTGNTGLQSSKDLTDDTSVIAAVRIYDHALAPTAMQVFAEEFPYVSVNGLATRTLAADGDWVSDVEWTLSTSATPAAQPSENMMVKLTTTGTNPLTAMVNLAAATSYETLTVDGTAPVTFTADVDEITEAPIRPAQTTISTPVTIAHGAIDLTGGPLTITETGSLTYDFSSLTAEVILAGGAVNEKLTGVIDEQPAGKVNVMKPEYPGFINAELVYEGGSYYFRAERTVHTLYWNYEDAEPTVWGTEKSAYVDAVRTTLTKILPADTIVFDKTGTVYVDVNYPNAIKVQVTNAATLTLGHNGGDATRNIPRDSVITVEAGSRVLFGWWGHATPEGEARIGTVTINGEGTWGVGADTRALRLSENVTGTAKLAGVGEIRAADTLLPTCFANATEWTGTVQLTSASNIVDIASTAKFGGTTSLVLSGDCTGYFAKGTVTAALTINGTLTVIDGYSEAQAGATRLARLAGAGTIIDGIAANGKGATPTVCVRDWKDWSKNLEVTPVNETETSKLTIKYYAAKIVEEEGTTYYETIAAAVTAAKAQGAKEIVLLSPEKPAAGDVPTGWVVKGADRDWKLVKQSFVFLIK